MNDEELASLKQNDDAILFLLEKYKYLVSLKARSYFLPGADRDDIIQEGMIGLYKAVRDFDISRNSNFYAFAEMCINRQIITAVKTAARKKHLPLNFYVPLDSPVTSNNSDCTIKKSLMVYDELNPEQIMIDKESYSRLNKDLNTMLTKLEKNTLNLYLDGNTYKQIGELLRKNSKSVDNALRRVKSKIDRYYLMKDIIINKKTK